LVVASQNIAHVGDAALGEQAGGLNQNFLAFPPGEAGRQQNHTIFRAYIPALTHALHARGIHSGACKAPQIGAAMNDRRMFIRKWIGTRNQACRIGTIGNDHITTRHHRIIKLLQGRLSRIRAVIGGDKGGLRALCRAQRHPCGSARARMDDVNIFALDYFGEAARIEPHQQRIFC
jgi:hypothetical protein